MSCSCCCSFCTSALTLVLSLSLCRAGMFPLAVGGGRAAHAPVTRLRPKHRALHRLSRGTGRHWATTPKQTGEATRAKAGVSNWYRGDGARPVLRSKVGSPRPGRSPSVGLLCVGLSTGLRAQTRWVIYRATRGDALGYLKGYALYWDGEGMHLGDDAPSTGPGSVPSPPNPHLNNRLHTRSS